MNAASTQVRLAVPSLLLANAILALGPVLVRMGDVGPVAAAFWRMALALPILTAAMIFLPRREQSARFTGPLVAIVACSGLLFAADIASWHLGIVRTTAANATLFGNSASLVFPLYGFLVARAWPSRRQGVAFAIAGLGAALLMGQSFELSPERVFGDLLSLAAGLFYATYFIVIARVRATLSPLPLLVASTFASAVPLLALSLVLHETILPTNWWPLIALSLGSQIVGQGLMVRALGAVSPLVIGLALLTQPVVAALTGWLVLGETLTMLDGFGAALVALGLVLVREPARLTRA